MKQWNLKPILRIRGRESLLDSEMPLKITPGEEPVPAYLTADIYPTRNPRPHKRHFGTWQFPTADIDFCKELSLYVGTDGVRLTADGNAISPAAVIEGGLKEDGIYTVYLVLAEEHTYAKVVETSYYRLLAFSGKELNPVEHWPGVTKRSPRTIQPEYWMVKKIADAVNQFALDLSPGLSVLDIGGGDAPYYPCFAARSIDYTNADVCYDQFVDVVYEPDSPLPFPDESFDAVICINVLEHVPNPEQIVSEMYRVLKTDGKILVCTPFAWEHHENPNDYRRFGRDGLQHLLSLFRELVIGYDANAAQAIRMLQNMHYFRSVKNKCLRNALIRWGNFRCRVLDERCQDESLTCNFIVTAMK